MSAQSGPPSLRSAAFRREREATWRELSKLVLRAEKSGVKSLGAGELARLAVLYRATLSSLSVARSISLDRNVVEYLETLSARAYFVVYGPRRRAWTVIREFFAWRLADVTWRARKHVGLATAALALGAVTGYVLTAREPDRYYAFVAEELAAGRDPSASDETLRETLYSTDHEGTGLLLFASYLFTHNAQVGMLAFALGFLAGVPVVLLLFVNGAVLGAFAALYASRGMGGELAAWIAPHGVPELFSLVLCGAGGLILGESLLFPGRHTRIENLRRRGPDAALLVVGAIVLDLWAALFEGFFRQLVLDPTTRFSFAFLNAAALVALFVVPLWRRR